MEVEQMSAIKSCALLTLLVAIPATMSTASADDYGRGPFVCRGGFATPVNGNMRSAAFGARGASEAEARKNLANACSQIALSRMDCLNLKVYSCTNDASGDTFADGYPHVLWCGSHEGVRFFDDAGIERPSSAIRQECLGKEGRPEQVEAHDRVARMSDADIEKAVQQSVEKVLAADYSNYDLLYHMTWCMRHEGHNDLPSIADTGDFSRVRKIYYDCQSHNPRVKNLTAVVPNAALKAAAHCAPASWPYGGEDHSSCFKEVRSKH